MGGWGGFHWQMVWVVARTAGESGNSSSWDPVHVTSLYGAVEEVVLHNATMQCIAMLICCASRRTFLPFGPFGFGSNYGLRGFPATRFHSFCNVTASRRPRTRTLSS